MLPYAQEREVLALPVDIDQFLADLLEREERMTVLPNDPAAVARYLRATARRTGRAA